jgi:hypothetical protein
MIKTIILTLVNKIQSMSIPKKTINLIQRIQTLKIMIDMQATKYKKQRERQNSKAK